MLPATMTLQGHSSGHLLQGVETVSQRPKIARVIHEAFQKGTIRGSGFGALNISGLRI